MASPALRQVLVVSLLLALGACAPDPAAGPDVVKQPVLSLTGVERNTGDQLLDGDVLTGLGLDAPTRLEARVPADAPIDTLWLHVQGRVGVQVGESATVSLDGEGWQSVPVDDAPRPLSLTIVPEGTAHVGELALWGPGEWLPRQRPEELLAHLRVRDVEGARLVAGEADAVLSPEAPCTTARFSLPVAPGQVHRAWLVYEGTGLRHPWVLRRSLNGRAFVGGEWVAPSGSPSPVIDELDPRALERSSSVTLCLPELATLPVPVSEPSLMVQLDQGGLAFTRQTEASFAAGLDGLPESGASLRPGEARLVLDRTVHLEAAGVELEGPREGLSLSMETVQGRTPIRCEESAGSRCDALLEQAEGLGTRALVLEVPSQARPDLPGPRLLEVRGRAHPLGPGADRIEVTWPRLDPAGRRGHFGTFAWVGGFVAGDRAAAGPVTVTVNGQPADASSPFAVRLSRPPELVAEPWPVTIEARFSDGEVRVREMVLETDRRFELTADGSPAGGLAGGDAAFGAPDEIAMGLVSPGEGGEVHLGSRVSLSVPPDAVDADTVLSIQRKGPITVPPLDAGLVNVTAPRAGAYRFRPPGARFKRNIQVRLPYDPALLPPGTPPEEVRTWFYDEAAEAWKVLPRAAVNRADGTVVSETDHFTFMINAVLTLPEHPGLATFDPNTMSDLEAALATSGIDLIAPPEPNNRGSARLSHPLRLPAGRGAHQPSLQLTYDSEGGDGLTGYGWSLSVPRIEVDTRLGVPRYDGTDAYTLAGQRLLSMEDEAAACVTGGAASATRYRPEVERSFSRIVRCRKGGDDWWEVTDTGGTLHLYGRSSEARLANYEDASQVAVWGLQAVIDPNGNLTRYKWFTDQRVKGDLRRHKEDFRYLYPKGIRYTGHVAGPSDWAARDAYDVGPFSVAFVYEHDVTPEKPFRDDVMVSGRFGFKTVLRRRLHAVRVDLVTDVSAEIPKGAFREYVLSYEEGQLGKWLLDEVTALGEGGRRFYAHAFAYQAVDPEQAAFADALEWDLRGGGSAQPGEAEALDAKRAHSHTETATAGVGFGLGSGLGVSAEGSIGQGKRTARGRAALADVNGDRLPDRLVREAGVIKVSLNRGLSGGTGTFAPARVLGDGTCRALESLSTDRSSTVTWGVGVSASAGVSVGVEGGGSWGTSVGEAGFLDVDGDGFVDHLEEGDLLRNLGPVTQDLGCFATLDSGPAGGGFGTVGGAGDFVPGVAVVEWTAPYAGRVSVSGAPAFRALEGLTGDGERDGVTIAVRRGATLLAERTFLRGEEAPTPFDLELDLGRGEHLYFLLTSHEDVPLGEGDDGDPDPLEEVEFSPVVAYLSCAGCDDASEPDVGPLGDNPLRFALEEDFRLSGAPMEALTLPIDGLATLDLELEKQATLDSVRVCLQGTPDGEAAPDVPCEEDDVLVEARAGEVFEGLSLPSAHEVSADDTLVLRVESDLPFDPADVRVTATLHYQCIDGSGDGSCRALEPDEVASGAFGFALRPYRPVHVLPRKPLAPMVMPADGTLRLDSLSFWGFSGATTLAVVDATGAVLEHAPGTSAAASVEVEAGDRLWALAVGPLADETNWTVVATLEPHVGAEVQVDAPLNRLEPQPEAGTGARTTGSVLAGGWRGWRFGMMTPETDKPFDPELFRPVVDEDVSDEEELAEILEDENHPLTRSLAHVEILLPRAEGTAEAEGDEGLKPGVPAFLSRDGTTFVTASSMHVGLRGAPATRLQGFGGGSALQTSFNDSAGFGGTFIYVNASMQEGSSRTGQQLLDLNADGYVDHLAVEDDGKGAVVVRLTDPASLAAGEAHRIDDVEGATGSKTLTFSAGLGSGIPMMEFSSGGRPVAVRSPLGAGVSIMRSAGVADLSDVNGDGLVDLVKRPPGARYLEVRLGLGGRFAQGWDRVQVDSWAEGTSGGFDAFLEEMAGEGAFPVMQNPNVLRHGGTGTVRAAAGFNGGYGPVSGGYTWSKDTSISDTTVVLADVTGDGLPDYLRKAPSDDGLRVMVNRGYDFGPEVEWHLPPWALDVEIPTTVAQGVASAAAELADKAGLTDRTKTLGANISYTDGYAKTLNFKISIPVLPPFVFITIGGSRSWGDWREGVEIGFHDMDGDGLPDHVLKQDGREHHIAVRRNQLGGANLLTAVTRPLGGSIEVVWDQRSPSVDDPVARWVMAETVVRDGLGNGVGERPATGHDFETSFTYDTPFYDRQDRAFRGFATTTQVNADGTRIVREWENEHPAKAGLLVRETVHDADGRPRLQTWNQYAAAVSYGHSAACDARRPAFQGYADYCESLFVPLERTTRTVWEKTEAGGWASVATFQSFEYDDYGNVVRFSDELNPGNTDDLYGVLAYTAADGSFVARHIVDRPTSVEVHQTSEQGPLLRHREATYTPEGNLDTMTLWTGQGRRSVTDLAWNRFGGLQKITMPPNEAGQRAWVRYTYDPATRTWPEHVEDVHRLTSRTVYDPRYGEALERVDPNGNRMVRRLDALGRLEAVWGPYDPQGGSPSIRFAYGPGGRASTFYKLETTEVLSAGGDTLLDVHTFVDGLGRTLQTQKRAEISGRAGYVVSAPKAYDVMGRTVREGRPHAVGSPTQSPATPPDDVWVHATRYGYDALGRVSQVARPLSPDTLADGYKSLTEATTETRYALAPIPGQGTDLYLRSTIINALGQSREEYRDLADRLTAVLELPGEAMNLGGERQGPLLTRYAYKPTGELTHVWDAAGNDTHLAYDLAGRRTSFSNADAGDTAYRYDAAGNLVVKVDSNLSERGAVTGGEAYIHYVYEFDRLQRIEYPASKDVVFEYGAPGAPDNDAGRIVAVEDEAGRETRGYGRLGEVVRVTRTVAGVKAGVGTQAYTTRFQYDSFGRMQWVQYPDGEVVRYGYDAGGLVNHAEGRMGGRRRVYVDDVHYDLYGQRERVTMGNGVVTSYTYDPASRARSTQSTSAGEVPLQKLKYAYDPVGRVRRALDRAGGGGAGPLPLGTVQTFRYDGLSRLIGASGRSDFANGTLDQYGATFAYDGLHNMTANTQAHTLVVPSGEAVHRKETNHRWKYVYGDPTKPHRLTALQDPDTGTPLAAFSYDANGNLLSEAWGAGQTETRRRRYEWNEENRLSRVVDNGRVTSFRYDAGGERVVKRGQYGETFYLGQWYTVRNAQLGTKHVFLGSTRIASTLGKAPTSEAAPPSAGAGDEEDPDPTELVRTLPPGIPIACGAGGGLQNGLNGRCEVALVTGAARPLPKPGVRERTYWYHPDHLGSTSSVTDDDGEAYEQLAYFPYGESWQHHGPQALGAQVGTRYTFTAKPEDPETGLMYFGARYYNAARAAWLSPDPALVEAQAEPSAMQLNPYLYASAMPSGAIDPDGRNTVWIGGAGVEEETARYSRQIVAFLRGEGVPYPVYIPSSLGSRMPYYRRLPKSLIAKPLNILATLWGRGDRRTDRFMNFAINPAVLASNRQGGQRNFVGYSYGSVVAAQSALYMADSGVYVDNVVLVGSPISDDSDLMQLLLGHENIGNVARIDISNDPFSDGIDLLGDDWLPRPIDPHFYYTRNDEGQMEALAKEVGAILDGSRESRNGPGPAEASLENVP